MSDELEVQMKLNLELQNQQKRVFNDPHSINPYKQVFLMYEERLSQISRIKDNGVKAFTTPNKKFRDFNSLKEQRKTHIRMFREIPTVMPPELVNKEKTFLTPDKYTLFNPRKETNSFDLDLIWNEKTSYTDEKLRCLAALVDKPDIYILSLVYQDPFALNVYDIDIGIGGKYTSINELLMQKSKLELKPNSKGNEINTQSYLIPASNLQKATSNSDYELPIGKENIPACVFGTRDEILALCNVASTDEPAVVGFAAAPLEEVLRILELYIRNEGKFSQFMTYRSFTRPSEKPRLTAVEFDESISNDPYEDLEEKMTYTGTDTGTDDDMDFVKEFDDFITSSGSITFPFSPLRR